MKRVLEREGLETCDATLDDALDQLGLLLLEEDSLLEGHQPADERLRVDDDAGVFPEKAEAHLALAALAEDDELDVVAHVERRVVDVHLRKVVLPDELDLVSGGVTAVADGASGDVQPHAPLVETLKERVEDLLGLGSGGDGLSDVHTGDGVVHDAAFCHAVSSLLFQRSRGDRETHPTFEMSSG